MAQNDEPDRVIDYQQGLLDILKHYQRRLDEIEKEMETLPQRYSSQEMINQQAGQWVQEILTIQHKAKLAAERIKHLRQS